MIEKKRQIEQLGNDDENGVTASSSYYKYYGVAKDLPGVKEHLAKEATMARNKRMKRSDRNQNYKSITPDYYGFRDEDDGVLLELEEQATQQLKRRYNITAPPAAAASDPNNQVVGKDSFLDGIQTQDEISNILLDIKKKALLKKYSLL